VVCSGGGGVLRAVTVLWKGGEGEGVGGIKDSDDVHRVNSVGYITE